jgi:hypothetical protein
MQAIFFLNRTIATATENGRREGDEDAEATRRRGDEATRMRRGDEDATRTTTPKGK